MNLATERSGNVQCSQVPELYICGPSGSPFFHWTHWTSVGAGYLNQKLSSAGTMVLKGTHLSEETKEKIRQANLGKKLSEETRMKMSLSRMGRKFSEETREKISSTKLGDRNPMFGHKGELSPRYGKRHTEESRRKMSETKIKKFASGEIRIWNKGTEGVMKAWNKGIPHSAEFRKKLSECHADFSKEKHPMYGKHHTELSKLKMSQKHSGANNPLYGEKHTPETIKKIIETRKKRLELGLYDRKSFGKGNRNKRLSMDIRNKISETLKKRYNSGEIISPMKGRVHSESTKKKLRLKLSGSGNPNFGKLRSDITRAKMRLNNSRYWLGRGSEYPEEAKKKLREHRLKQVFPIKDTKIERILQDELKKTGAEFKTHIPLVGQPDIFIEPNICIFCDGDYWHANPIRFASQDIIKKKHMLTAKQIWDKDNRVNEKLKDDGYVVLRFWEHDIKNSPQLCISEILQAIHKNGGN